MSAELFLIPSPINQKDEYEISASFLTILNKIEVLVVENLRTSRRILRKYGYKKDFDSEVVLIELDKHDDYKIGQEIQTVFRSKKRIGLMSEAGVPCVADPGNKVVLYAHSQGCKIVPLTGSSSILKALMSSGLNGQNFAFQGYVPIESGERNRFWNKISERVRTENQTQIFMDAPYRNDKLIQEVLKTLNGEFYLSLSVNIDSENAFIKTLKIKEWKTRKIQSFHKIPMMCVVGNE